VNNLLGMSEAALLLGGFVLAHAAWSISDAPDLLCPLAMLERAGKRELLRFAAETQAEAISKAKEMLASVGTDVNCWAFAREGLFNEGGSKMDVISVDVWARPNNRRITLIQRFEPYAKRQHFQLLGEPEISSDGNLQERSEIRELLTLIHQGVSQHSKVAPLWHTWNQP
jgi:hypothetical protein